MSDIVERLRDIDPFPPLSFHAELRREAADEIERQAMEIARLREANQKWLEYSQREIEPELKEQVADLTVECKRLQAALREIVKPRYGEPQDKLIAIKRVASEALGDD